MANMTQYVFGVTADTKAAEKSLSSLSKSLRSLLTKRISLDVDDSRINAAAEAAELLQHELTKAMNVKTNSLDLSKLTAGLKAANTDVSLLGKTLLNAGTEGQRAFSQLANTIANSLAPVKQLSKAFSTMGTTLMNTIKWQASSSLIHGLMSTISGAISYAKNLNSTLNDIRIVTGASEAEMSRFASTANKMAKELSTTTNEFAKASLIYYQQGDNAELAAKKAAITVKAANVAFTASAQEMSEMLTAVWNSYQMGEDQLEHAVDVMAALGATTASSMEEMATAMQKVAATANNVGVSMEQMSAIVSTAASVTRQAPETIGTAWNTILNRISGLKLGETLEDGVDLNKYSKALATIGVNILDASGDLRDMGSVIDEIGEKWENLSKAQQNALAQTIGGARQYTQINAFFDNFEKYQKNMETARNSEGALQEQADIYAESWEAASNRVRASLESIYTLIFDDKALTKMTSFFATLIDHIGKLTTSFGGIGNVVSLLATQIISTHLEQFSTRLVEIGHNIKQVFSGNEEIQNYADSIALIQQQMTLALDYSDMSASGEIELKYDIEILNVKRQIAEQQGKMTQAQKEAAEMSIRNLQLDKQYYVQLAEQAEKIAKALRDLNVELTKLSLTKAMSKKAFEDYDTLGSHDKMIVDNMMADDLNNYFSLLGENGEQAYKTLEDIATELGVIQDADQTLSLDVFNKSVETAHDNLTQIESSINYLKESFTGANGQFAIPETMDPTEVFGNALNGASFTGMTDELREQINSLKEELKGMSPDDTTTEQWQAFAQRVSTALNQAKDEAQKFKDGIKLAVLGTDLATSVDELNGHFDKFSANTEKVADAAAANLAKLKGEIDTKLSAASLKVQTFVSAAMALSRCVTAINAIGNAFKTLQDSDADAWTKITTCISTLVTVAMAASSVMQLFSKSTLSAKLASAKLAAQLAVTSATTAAHAGAATAAAGANTSMGVSFHAAAAGAKAFMASLGPIGWILLAVTVIGGAVAGITSAIANLKKEIAKNKKEAVDAYEGIISKLSNLSASYTSLNSILSDNTKTLSEQLDKINEITEAWGLLVDAVDLAGESYAGLNSKLLNYQRSSILDDIAVLEQASEKYKNNITLSNTYYTKLESEIMGQFNDEDSEMYVRYKNYIKENTTEELFNNDWEFNDKWGEITYFGDDDLYMPDWFVNYLKESKGLTINDIGEFANNSDSLQLFDSEKVGFGLVDEDFVKLSFNLTDAGLQRLVDAGVYTKQEYSTGAPPKYRRNIITADQWPEIEELLLDPSLYTNLAELEQLAAMQKTLLTKYGINNILQNNDNIDLLNISGEKVGLSDFNKLMLTNGIANPDWTMLSDMAAFFQDLPAYTDAASQYIQLGQYAQTLKTASGSLVEIPDIQLGLINFLESDTAKEMELDVDTLVTLRPGALAIDATGKITVNDNDAIDLAKLKIKADNLDIEADKLETFKGWKEDTLTAEQYTEMKESGYFTEEELSTLLYGDKKVRQNLLDKKIEANKKAQNDTDKDLLAKNRIEQDRIKEDLATWEALKATNETEYYSYQTKGRVQVKDRSYVQLATDLSTARSRSSVYGKGLALNGIEYDKLTDDLKKDALAAYNALMNTNKTELDEEMYKGMMGEGNIKIMQDRRTLAEETVLALSGVVDEYEILDSRLSELETEEEDLEASTTAYDEYDGKIAKIKQLNTAITTYQGLVGKNKKLSADELKSLKEINQELYTKYKTGLLTDEEWDEAVRNAEIEKLQQLKTEYQNANQEEQAFATQQEIDAIKLEQNTAAIEKATKAYSKYTQEITKLKDTSSKMKSGVDILTNNIDSGKELTQEQVTTLSQSGLTIDVDAYNNAANATERAAIAANAWSQYLILSQTVLEKEQALYNNIDARAQDKLDNWSPTALEKQIKDVDKFIIDEFGALGPEVEGQAKAMFEQMEKDGIDTSHLTYEQAFQYLCEYSKKSVNENQAAFDLMKANGVDTMKSLWSEVADAERDAAEKTVSDWEDAFDTISKMKQKMLKGESIADSVFGDFEDYQTMYKAALEAGAVSSPQEFNKKVARGEYIPTKTPDYATQIQNQRDASGLNSFTVDSSGLYQTYRMQLPLRTHSAHEAWLKANPNGTTEEWMASTEYKNAKDLANEQIRSDLTALLKAGGYDEKEIPGLIDKYMANDEATLEKIREIATQTSEIIVGQMEGQEINTQMNEAEILQTNALTNKQAAYDIMQDVIENRNVDKDWFADLDPDELKSLADQFGITTAELKRMPFDWLEDKFINLGLEIEDTESQYDALKQAIAEGKTKGKEVSGFKTLEGDRIWEDTENKLTMLPGFAAQESADAAKELLQTAIDNAPEGSVEFADAQVVQGPDGKYYIVKGSGISEASLTEGFTGLTDSTYGQDAREAVTLGRKDAQSDWISNRRTELNSLEDLQDAMADTTISAEALNNQWSSFYGHLDTTNPKIVEAYNELRNAERGTQEWRDAVDNMTTVLLQQGDLVFEDTEELRLFCEEMYEANEITDDFGEQLNATSLNSIHARRNLINLSAATKDMDKNVQKATTNTKYYTAKTLRELRRELKSDGKTMKDFTKDNKNLSKEEKELLNDTSDLIDSFEDLGHEMGLEGNELDNFVDRLLDADDIGDIFNATIETLPGQIDAVRRAFEDNDPTDGIKGWEANLGTNLDAFKSSAAEMLGTTENDVITLMDQCTNAIAKAGGNISAVDWGTLANELGVDLSTVLQIMISYLRVLEQANAVEGLDVSGIISQLEAAISAAQSFNSKHGGGGAKNGESPSSGGSGGGGGGSKKNYENHKKFTEEVERYHEINQQLEKLQRLLDKLDKQKSMTFGAAHLKAIDEEIAALEKENQLNQEKLNETRANLSSNAALLQRFGATMNSDGTLNYDELMAQAVAEYNAAVDKYNTSEQTAQDDLALQRAKEHYEELMNLIDDYEEDLKQLDELEADILENQIKRSAAEIEKIEYKIEVEFDLNDRSIKELQYFRTKWEETLSKQGNSFNGMIQEAYKYEDNLAILGDAVDTVNLRYAAGAITLADYAAELLNLNDKMLEQLENLTTIKKSIKEAYGNTLELASQQMENFTSILDHSREVMESYISMQQLMGRGQNFSELTKFYQTQYDSSLSAASAAKQYNEELLRSKELIEAQIEAAGGWETAGEVLQQQWVDVNNALTENENDLLSKTQQALEDAQAMFENTLQAAIDSFDKMMTKAGTSLRNLEDDYAYYQEEKDRYLSTAKELYEVSKLNREIETSLVDSTTKASKERLKALKEEINAKAEAGRLTEYDVNMMELQYKYALALEDLEDKKNAKSVVRLTRDEEGNYGYQYTANEDEVSGAAQQVEDVLDQIHDLAASRVSEIEQAALTAEREYRDGLLEIAQDTTLTLDERMEKMRELTRQHQETMQYYQEQYGNATSNLLENQRVVYERYGVSMLENSGKIQEEINADIKSMMDNVQNYASELAKQVAPGGTIYEAMQKYKADINLVQDTTGLSWANMTTNTEEYAEANKKAQDAIKGVKSDLDAAITSIDAATKNWLTHGAMLDAIILKYETLNNLTVGTLNDLATAEATGTLTTNGKVGKYLFAWAYKGLYGVASGFDTSQAAYDAAVVDMTGKFKSLVQQLDEDADTATIENIVKGWIEEARSGGKINVNEYATGGLVDYTGPAWVDGTKSAPELMLNASDTQNLLSTIDLLHSIDTLMIKNLFDTMQMSAVAIMSSFGSLASGSVMMSKDRLEQDVHIEANFPNVTEKDEIVDAFNDLINLASQYANR